MKILDLPKEIHEHFLSFLPWKDLVNTLTFVSVSYSEICSGRKGEGLWKSLCLTNFGDDEDVDLESLSLDFEKNDKYRDYEWCTWKRLFVFLFKSTSDRLFQSSNEKFKKITEDEERKKQVKNIFCDITRFCDLGISDCQNLKIPNLGYGDYQIHCYFFPKIYPVDMERKFGKFGFSKLLHKENIEPIDENLLKDITTEFQSAITKAHNNNNLDEYKLTQDFEKKYHDLVEKHGLWFDIDWREAKICIQKGVFKDPNSYLKEGSQGFISYSEFEKNEERIITSFSDFVAKCCVDLIAQGYGYEDMEELKNDFGLLGKDCWDDLLTTIGKMEEEYFLPMYHPKVVRAAKLIFDGNFFSICAEGVHGYYYLFMDTS